MSAYVFGFQEIDKTKVMTVGGKGANLGELSKLDGIRVPDGFCLSTQAFHRMIGDTPALHELLDQLSLLELAERDKIAQVSGEIRRAIEDTTIPQAIQAEITAALSRLGVENAYAVRSSATAEDLPTASFAGQQDTYLNVIGRDAILAHIKKCWASLYTERAVTYRLQNGFDQRKVYLAVVVQQMIFPQVAGVLFTADPVTSNRKVVSVDASFGLGEALVSGLVNADNYQVRYGKGGKKDENHEVIEKKIATKKLAIYALPTGGTKRVEIDAAQQNWQALTDTQILALARMGRRIEEHFGHPQDIEWCLADDTFYIVQSRPITTLYPIPNVDDGEKHVYISVAHQQMMTDPMKPLGLSLFQLTAGRPMFEAGGRLFVDIAQNLAVPATRKMVVNALGQSEPLIKDALATLLAREDVVEPLPDGATEDHPIKINVGLSSAQIQAQVGNDPGLVATLIERSQRSLDALQAAIQTKSGVDLCDFILEDIQQLKKNLSDPQSVGVIFGAMNASAWLNEKMMAWLGEKNVADTLSQSVPNNITSEMGLALLDVADAIRAYPQVIAYLQQADEDRFWDELVKLEGGQEVKDALVAFLDQYGMRGVGEIDISRARWREKPTMLVPMLLSNIKNLAPNASKRKFEQGQQEALQKEEALLEQLKQLPDGEEKAQEAKQMIRVLRDFIGYREYPKYGMVNRYSVYKQALLKEAERLVQANVIQDKEDIYYLSFDELREVVRTHTVDAQMIHARKEAYQAYKKLTPPRVMTSDGEIIVGKYQRADLPAGAMAGLPVSSGIVEGRARVILQVQEAALDKGDILVTSFTDPSWTPLFVSIAGLVTEVGGLMTHGAVIAREYGLPAIVGVENATRLIQDGQRIRVNGTDGYVEILSE